MASFGYLQGIKEIYESTIDLIADDIRCAVMQNSYTPSQSGDQFWSDISANEIVGGGYSGAVLLQNKSITTITEASQATFNADDITDWERSTFKNARYFVIYKDTGVSATSPLIALIDLGGNRNAPITFSWSDNGIFGFNSANSAFDVEDFENAEDPLLNWTYTSAGWTEQTNPDVVPLTSDDFDAINQTWQKYVDCNTAGTPFGFDSVGGTLSGTNLSVQGQYYKEGSASFETLFDGMSSGNVAYGEVQLAAPTSTFVFAFWFNLNLLRIVGTGYANIAQWYGGGTSAGILRISKTDETEYKILILVREDSGSYISTQLATYDPREENPWIHIIVMGKAATAPAANDGFCDVLIDGDTTLQLAGLDNDTYSFDTLRVGCTGTNDVPTGRGFIDEVYFDDAGAPFTVAINPMQGRSNYSMCVPSPTGNQSYGYHNISLGYSAGLYIEVDAKHAFAYTGVPSVFEFYDVSLVKGGWVQYDSFNSRARVNYQDDAGVTQTGSWYSTPITADSDVTLAVYYKPATAPAANDGIVQLYINGVLKEDIRNADTDTFAIDRVLYGRMFSLSQPDCVWLGTMRYSIESAPVSIKKWAAINGSYGAAQYFKPGGFASASFKKSFTDSDKATYEIAIDLNNLTITAGDTFTLTLLRDTTSARVTGEVDITNSGGDYQLKFYYLDAALAKQLVGTYTMPAGLIVNLRVLIQRSSSAITTDGYMFVWIDGVLQFYEETIQTVNIDVDVIDIIEFGVDSGTYGTIFFDDIGFNGNAVFFNPLDSTFDNPAYNSFDLTTTMVSELESEYFLLFQMSLTSKVPTILGRIEQNIAGQAEYKVILRDTDGSQIAQFDNWNSLVWTRINNVRHNIRFQPLSNDIRRSLFTKDRIIEVWRKNDIVDLDWYKECEGFYRTKNENIDVNDRHSFVAFALGGIDLLVRAHVMWYEGTPQADKSGAGETIMKEYVYENIGAGALNSLGRIADNVMPYFEIEADAGLGDTWTGQKSYGELYETLRAISDVSAIDFEVVGGVRADGYYWTFKTWYKQRNDRTIGNTEGNIPVIFDVGRGNMRLPTFSRNATIERTAVYAIGQGRLDEALIVLEENADAIIESPWNRSEIVVKGSNEQNDEASLTALATQRLFEEAERVSIDFDALQTKSCYYGIHYFLGDRVSSIFDGERIDKKIRSVKGIISNPQQGEQINVEFEATPGVGGYEE